MKLSPTAAHGLVDHLCYVKTPPADGAAPIPLACLRFDDFEHARKTLEKAGILSVVLEKRIRIERGVRLARGQGEENVAFLLVKKPPTKQNGLFVYFEEEPVSFYSNMGVYKSQYANDPVFAEAHGQALQINVLALEGIDEDANCGFAFLGSGTDLETEPEVGDLTSDETNKSAASNDVPTNDSDENRLVEAGKVELSTNSGNEGSTVDKVAGAEPQECLQAEKSSPKETLTDGPAVGTELEAAVSSGHDTGAAEGVAKKKDIAIADTSQSVSLGTSLVAVDSPVKSKPARTPAVKSTSRGARKSAKTIAVKKTPAKKPINKNDTKVLLRASQRSASKKKDSNTRSGENDGVLVVEKDDLIKATKTSDRVMAMKEVAVVTNEVMSPVLATRFKKVQTVKKPTGRTSSNPALVEDGTPAERMRATDPASGVGDGMYAVVAGSAGAKPNHEPRMYAFPTFEQIKPFLEKAGFRFGPSLYCRPVKSLRDAVPGEDRFQELTAFRRDLCARGLDGKCPEWTEDEAFLVERWVRFAILRVAPVNGRLPEYKLLTTEEAKGLLTAIGFTFNNHYSWYWIPDANRADPFPGLDCFEKDVGKNGLFAYLSRQGFPSNCDFGKITPAERLSLELFMAYCSQDYVETFTIQAKDDFSSSKPGVRASRRNSSHSSTGADMAHRMKKRYSLDASTVSANPGSAPGVAKRRKTSSSESPQSNLDLPPVAITTHKDPTINSNSSQVSLSPDGQHKARPEVIRQPERETPMPDKYDTLGEKLDAALMALMVDESTQSLSFNLSAESSLHFNLNTVMTFLNGVIDSAGRHGATEQDAAALYVCGRPGTGKTSGVRWCFEELLKKMKTQDDPDHTLEPVFCRVSANHLQAGNGAHNVLMNEISAALGDHVTTAKSLRANLTKTKRLLVLVLDEVDTMLSTGKQREPTVGTEKLLQSILKWANDGAFKMALVGIANTIGTWQDGKYERLHNLGKFQDTVNFAPYSQLDLQRIIQDRIGTNVVADAALKMICSSVAGSHGDARAVLELTSHVIEHYKKTLTPDELNVIPSMPVVTAKHVNAVNQEKKRDLGNRLKTLPLVSQAAVCAVAVLARESVVSVNVQWLLRTSYKAVTQHPEPDDFLNILDGLRADGYIKLEKGDNKPLVDEAMATISQRTITLGIQLDEIVEEVNKLMEQHPLFARIRDEVETYKQSLA